MNQILIYKPDNTCYNILNFMAEQLGGALASLGIDVVYYDASLDGAKGITDFIGKRFLAVIGFQSAAFKVRFRKDNAFLHDSIYGPKINIFFDHPIFLHEDCLDDAPNDYYIFTHDVNYMDFVKKYYPQVKDVFLLPPGGCCEKEGGFQKTIELSFLGSYVNYRRFLPSIRDIIRKERLAGEYLECLRADSAKSQEEALKEVVRSNNRLLSDNDFIRLFDSIKIIQYMLNAYNREKVVERILNAGINVTAYDEVWRSAPFYDSPFLNIRPAVTPEESLMVYSKSKLSLNVMSGHKAGFTERIANSMLNKSVVLSDYSSCLDEQYENGKELILFRLEELDEVAERIKEILENENIREEIADRAYKRAYAEDTWLERAKLLIRYLYDINC